MNVNTSESRLPDELGERISAYLDGELPPAEAAEMQRLIADDPAARRVAEQFGAVGRVVRDTPTPAFSRDLSGAVVAEALRRQNDGAVDVADRLEPEGEFGLPFGKSSRGWMWAVFAAAAAVMIGFFGRPDRPTGGPAVAARPTPEQIERSLVAMRQAAPGMRVVNYQATPSRLAQLQRLLAQRANQPSQLPVALRTISKQSGVVVEPATRVVPVEPGEEVGEELICVDADEAELDRLLGELDEGEVIRVESDRPAPPKGASAQPGAGSAIRGVWRIRLTPEAAARLGEQKARLESASPSSGRRFVVLRIRVKQGAQPE